MERGKFILVKNTAWQIPLNERVGASICLLCKVSKRQTSGETGDGVAKVVVDEISEEVKDDAIDAMEGCPVAAIVEEKEEEK